ncbi:hypothetical protein [Mycolicibacterium septicum]|uniref:hypothetical protein n=1 Tax=Mycolicibacterium septicum TaxID=98668 RepID=UPI001AF55620|nr:hypothetical protein [Mycolicibacterium septicum]QRY53807.1 hypothetical protein JVX95_11060 [Mycolicibacterium septicum]
MTYKTRLEDWAVTNADAAWVNKQPSSIADAVRHLVEQRNGTADIMLGNAQVRSEFQFEFALAEKRDLEGVDSALEHLIRGAGLSMETLDTFIMDSKRYASATRYYSALADYLYGAAMREDDEEHGDADFAPGRAAYEDRFDSAVNILGTFDRPPAEAICGIVAFHYNQFGLAMTKTRSQRVAEVSMRFEAMLRFGQWNRRDLAPVPHGSLDYALSDGIMEQVLRWSCIPIDGTAPPSVVEDMVEQLDRLRPLDQFKLHLIGAEHFLAAGDRLNASKHADLVRHGPAAQWYSDFRSRLERGMEQ